MSLIDTLRDKVKGGRHKPYPLDDETGQLLEQFLSAYDAQDRYLLDEIGTEAEQLLALPNARRVELIKYLITEHGAGERPVVGYRSEPWLRLNNLSQLASKLFRRKLEIPEPDLIWMLKALSKQSYSHYTQSVLTATERHLQSHGLNEPIKAALRKLRRKIYHHSLGDVIDRTDVLLNDGVRPLFSQEPWGAEVLALHGGDERWRTLLAHAATARAARPAKKWLKQAQEHLGTLGNDTTVGLLGRSFEIVLAQDHTELPLNSRVDTGTMRGLIWIASLLDDKQLIDTVHRLGEYAFRKVPGVGAVSTKVGNSVIYTLGALPGIEAISRLTALRRSVKYRQARKLIGTALEKAADERGISVAMLEELAVPTYGFNSEGEFRQPFGEELTARVVLGPGGKAQISWERNNGKVQKSVPKQVRETCPDELKALRKQAKDIGKGWLAQRDRVERMMRDPVSWTVTDWQERYLNHAFMLHFARKLLWELECSGDRKTVCALDGKLADLNDEPVDPAPGSTISLWHPIGCDTKTILEWRRRLEEKGITQPFKQAHREVYILTPAERETEAYSNRFAGHILRQHQAAALFQERGWSYSLQGEFDSWNSSALVLPDRDLSVEFFVSRRAIRRPATVRYSST